MKATFNYSTHYTSVRNEVASYLQEQGVTFKEDETISPITGVTTFHFEIILPFGETEEITKAREVTNKVSDLIGWVNAE